MKMNRLDRIYGRTVAVSGSFEKASEVAARMIEDRGKEFDKWKVVFERVQGGYILREKRNLGGYKWA